MLFQVKICKNDKLFFKSIIYYEKNLYQRNIDLKVIDFPLIKQSNDLKYII